MGNEHKVYTYCSDVVLKNQKIKNGTLFLKYPVHNIKNNLRAKIKH